MVAQSQHGHPSRASPSVSRLTGSAVAGVTELFLFHPVDTIAKRLMTAQTAYVHRGSASQTLAALNTVIFRDKATASVPAKARSLFPGLGFAGGYKVLQRVYKFGGQPYVNEFLERRYGAQLTRRYGSKTGQSLQQAMAGSLIGVGEALLLPLDIMKIKAQTNPAAVAEIKAQPLRAWLSSALWRSLYSGFGWTAARNAPGSFALFGGAAAVYSHVFLLDDYHYASFGQSMTASFVGAALSILVSQPLDVIKTRVQQAHISQAISGREVIARLLACEGVSALFKGLTPKLLIVGPKLVFSFTIASHIIHTLERAPAK